MILSPFSVPYIFVSELSPSGHWGQFGDRMETERRQKGDKKMSMISHEGLVGETFICIGFRAMDAL